MYDLSDQANEMRAKLITIQSEVNFNTEQVAKTKRYSDLVHAAWKEAIALKKNVKSLLSGILSHVSAISGIHCEKFFRGNQVSSFFLGFMKHLADIFPELS